MMVCQSAEARIVIDPFDCGILLGISGDVR